jgi:hypothetical protein
MVNSFEERVSVPVPVIRRVSLAAIFGGLAVALGIQLLLSLLGIGIGASTIHPTSENGASAENVGTGSAIWFVVSGLISLFAGGWVAGRLAGIPRSIDAVIHGIITWSLTALLTVYLLTTAVGGVISGATGALGSLFSAAGTGMAAAGSGIAAVAPDATQEMRNGMAQNGITPDTITLRVQKLLRETGNAKLRPEALKREGKHQANLAKGAAKDSALDPHQTKEDYNELVYRFLHDSGVDSRTADRQDLINVVATEQHITKTQASRTVDEWSQEAKQAQEQAKRLEDEAHEKAKQAGEAAAAAVTKAALSGFVLFLLGMIAAAFGGFVSIRSIIADELAAHSAVTYTRI